MVDAVSVYQVVGGKIAGTWEVWDTLTFLQQIGVVPLPGQGRAGWTSMPS